MKRNEAVASARRIGPLRAVDAAGDPVLGEDFSGMGELEIKIDGGAWAVPTGTIEEIGDGYYYYQATLADAGAEFWVAIKITGVCEEFTFRENIETRPNGISIGEADSRIGPLYAVDEAGDPVTGETFADAGELEVTVNGAALAAGQGSIVEDSDGYYYYVADPDSELTERGWIAVKIAGPCVEFMIREDVIAPDDGAPEVEIISPTPGVAPGEPGGFPAREADARLTPIVLQITDVNPGVGYLAVIVRMYIDDDDANPVEEVVYRRNSFRGNYVSGSTQTPIANGIELSVLRAGGWPTTVVTGRRYIVFAVDAVDGDGNLSA